ncbi:PIF1-like helicase, putative [Leishmania donovani]|uniref:PIF1-like helicase, putative n=1 Tax=Leishmania donovani TaxID=5661 RepID=A0A3Q8I7Q1_LEIDO|nr:PIF1-like helicase, putative [Leishmania donovani]AYU76673.1 PIF1-like helicase, putative [Leishmania donovani]
MRDGVHRFGPRGLARCVDCVEGETTVQCADTHTIQGTLSFTARAPSQPPSLCRRCPRRCGSACSPVRRSRHHASRRSDPAQTPPTATATTTTPHTHGHTQRRPRRRPLSCPLCCAAPLRVVVWLTAVSVRRRTGRAKRLARGRAAAAAAPLRLACRIVWGGPLSTGPSWGRCGLSWEDGRARGLRWAPLSLRLACWPRSVSRGQPCCVSAPLPSSCELRTRQEATVAKGARVARAHTPSLLPWCPLAFLGPLHAACLPRSQRGEVLCEGRTAGAPTKTAQKTRCCARWRCRWW